MTLHFTDTKPTLQELLSLPFGNKTITIMKTLAPKWQFVAIQLGFDDTRRKIIESDSLPPHQTEKACTEMLQEWLALLEVLEIESIKELRLASEIRQALMTL